VEHGTYGLYIKAELEAGNTTNYHTAQNHIVELDATAEETHNETGHSGQHTTVMLLDWIGAGSGARSNPV